MRKRPREDVSTLDERVAHKIRKIIEVRPRMLFNHVEIMWPDPWSLESRNLQPIYQRQPKNGSSPLLNVPPEIRILIYEHLLPHRKYFCFCPSLFSISNSLSDRIRDANFNILQVSKLINREASSVLYGKNILRLTPQTEFGTTKPQDLIKELDLISERNRRFIRNIEVHIGPVDYFAIAVGFYIVAMSRCSALYRLYVFVHKPNWIDGTPLFPTKQRTKSGQPRNELPSLDGLVIKTSHGHRQAIEIPVANTPRMSD